MNEETVKVLGMVSEGKISAEEAERLLEALEVPRQQATRRTESAPGSERHGSEGGALFGSGLFRRRQLFEGGRLFGRRRAGQAEGPASPQKLRLAEDAQVHVKCGAGNVEIEGCDTDTLEASAGPGASLGQIKADQERIYVKAGAQNVKVSLPRKLKVLAAKAGAGNLKVTGVSASALRLKSGAGDVSLDTDAARTQSISMKSAAGNLVLRVPPDASLSFKARSKRGDIHCELPVEGGLCPTAECGATELEGVVGGGATEVELCTVAGDISILARKPQGNTDQPAGRDFVPDQEKTHE